MRHLAPLVVVVVAICSSSTAFAADHRMRVDEVLVSKNGDTAVQFIELDDPALEPFPSNPYGVEIYDAAGTKLGNTVQLTVTANTQRILVGTAAADTAFGTSRDGTLPVTLPANGQACFVRVTASEKIMCLAWGCITTQIVAPVMVRAPSPPDDQSVQRQTNDTYQLAAPTPDATNVAGTLASNCPTEPDAPIPHDGPRIDGPLDAGPTADSGGGGNNNGDDGGGCCQVEGSRGAAGACLLALAVLILVRRRRRAV